MQHRHRDNERQNYVRYSPAISIVLLAKHDLIHTRNQKHFHKQKDFGRASWSFADIDAFMYMSPSNVFT